MKDDPGLAGWLQLTLTPGLTSSTLRRLLADFGLPEQVLARTRSQLGAYASPDALAGLFSDAVGESVARALAWAREPGHAVVTLADAGYPRALLEIPDPPALLHASGRVELLMCPMLAVVG